MTKSHLMLHLHSPSLSPLYSSPFYIPFSTSPFYTPSISSFYNLPLHPFLQLVQLNRRWAPHWSQDKPPIWLTPLPLYLLFAPLFYIPSLHPYFTPYLPISTYLHIPTSCLTPLWHSLSTFLLFHSTLTLCTPYLSSSLPTHSTTPF